MRRLIGVAVAGAVAVAVGLGWWVAPGFGVAVAGVEAIFGAYVCAYLRPSL